MNNHNADKILQIIDIIALTNPVTKDIVNYIKREENLAIGETTAEQIKIQIGCAMPLMTEMTMEVRGRDLGNGLPRNVIVTSTQIEEAMHDSINEIVEVVKATLEKTPPELASDIMENGIMLTGGGALLKGLDLLVKEETGMPVFIAEYPLDCVAIGTGKSVEDMVYEAQRKVILDLAEKEPCVIIGRNADYILKDRDDVLNVYIHGDMPEKIQRICKLHNTSEADAVKMINDIDKRRMTNYNFYTDQKWGKAANYTLCLNSSQLGYDKCESVIIECV